MDPIVMVVPQVLVDSIDWPAWVQAIGSVVGIFAAIGAIYLSAWVAHKRQAKTHLAAITAIAESAVALIEVTKISIANPNGQTYAPAAWDRIYATMQTVRLMDLPNANVITMWSRITIRFEAAKTALEQRSLPSDELIEFLSLSQTVIVDCIKRCS